MWLCHLTQIPAGDGRRKAASLGRSPVLLGTGKRFFAEGTPPHSFALVSTLATPSGVILSTYKVAGPLKTG
jgi:hypothetical protein